MYAGDQSTLLAEFQLEKRDPLASADQVSPYVLKGTVDTEDVRFYEHTGVDLPGIARAVLVNLGGGALEGASTITQQLVRNTVLSEEANDISFERKIREAQLAVDMEKMYSKDEILLMYLNTINYGDGCYGIEAAAQNYFQVSALNLTLVAGCRPCGHPPVADVPQPEGEPGGLPGAPQRGARPHAHGRRHHAGGARCSPSGAAGGGSEPGRRSAPARESTPILTLPAMSATF